jgi:Cysteine dioxygenase type I
VPLVHPALAHHPLIPPSVLGDEPDLVDVPRLAALAAALAGAPESWRPLVRHRPETRWYTRLVLSGSVEVWLIGWCSGQHTKAHDHGGAVGALAVAEGVVSEEVFDRDWAVAATRRHRAGDTVGFTRDHAHRVGNRSRTPATTVHAYSPPEMPLRYAPADRSEWIAIPLAAAAASGTAGPPRPVAAVAGPRPGNGRHG